MLKRFVLSLFLILFSYGYSQDKNFSIESVYVLPFEKDSYDVSIKANITLSSDQIRLLESGIPLTYVYNLIVQEKKSLNWITNYNAYYSYRYTISYNMLTQQYVVKTKDNKHYENFPTLTLALSYISEPSNLPLLIVNKQENKEYRGGVQLKLDIESLPIPIKIPAYLSSTWSLTSGWKYWDL